MVQEVSYVVPDQNDPIIIVSDETKEEIEANAYLLRRMLYTVEQLSAENIKITVKGKDFEAIKNQLG